MLEREMFAPIKEYIESLGFAVKAEVNDIDVMAIKGDLILLIEMKTSLSIKLLYQGCSRQKLSDNVYIAVPKPTMKILKSKSFKEKLYLVKRLHLGLIFVDVKNNDVVVHIDPSDFTVRRSKRNKIKLLKEFSDRVTSYNEGGVTKTKIVTAYRESAILIAYYLLDGALAVKDIRKITGIVKTQSILQKNYYKWFDRVQRGIYELNEFGRTELIKYQNVLDEVLNSSKNVKNT